VTIWNKRRTWPAGIQRRKGRSGMKVLRRLGFAGQQHGADAFDVDFGLGGAVGISLFLPPRER